MTIMQKQKAFVINLMQKPLAWMVLMIFSFQMAISLEGSSLASATDCVFIVESTKHSDWDLNKHWLEIKTSDGKVYQVYLDVIELEKQHLMKGDEVLVQDEQILFYRFGYSSYNLFIPRVNTTLIGEALGTIAYAPEHEGKEVHALFEVSANLIENSLSFRIENGEKFKLFFNDVDELESWRNGQEIEIFHQESLYEKDPLIVLGVKKTDDAFFQNIPLLQLGIKNFEINKDYLVKASEFPFHKWLIKDRYPILTKQHFIFCGEENSGEYDLLRTADKKGVYWMDPWQATVGIDGDQVMTLELLSTSVDNNCYGRIFRSYKLLNLRLGVMYVQVSSTGDPIPIPQ